MNPAIQQWMDAIQESPKMDLDDKQIELPQKRLRQDWDFEHAKLSPE